MKLSLLELNNLEGGDMATGSGMFIARILSLVREKRVCTSVYKHTKSEKTSREGECIGCGEKTTLYLFATQETQIPEESLSEKEVNDKIRRGETCFLGRVDKGCYKLITLHTTELYLCSHCYDTAEEKVVM